MKGALLLTAALLGLPSGAMAQVSPFGLPFGVKSDSLRQLVGGLLATGIPGVYKARKVPTPHSAFTEFLLVAPPGHGLCKIVASSYEVPRDAYGERIRELFADIRAALTEKYGEPQVFDLLKTGSLWKEPREWVMSILQKDRNYAAFWGVGDAPLVPGLKGIQLSVTASDMATTQLQLSYEAEGFAECLAEARGEEKKAF